jgi:hypothetical protein
MDDLDEVEMGGTGLTVDRSNRQRAYETKFINNRAVQISMNNAI